MPGSVWQRTLAALVRKTFLHFSCLKTTDRQAWAGYNMTWPTWASVLSQWYCGLLIQTNCTELQPSINSLIWFTWLFINLYFNIYFQLLLASAPHTCSGTYSSVIYICRVYMRFAWNTHALRGYTNTATHTCTFSLWSTLVSYHTHLSSG